MEDFIGTTKWWRTEVATDITITGDGVAHILQMLQDEARHPFFIMDRALAEDELFAPLMSTSERFMFDATASEPRTGDVDALVKQIKDATAQPDVIIGVGGGGTMDLAKAVAICMNNPRPAAFYQGWGLDMAKGLDCWVMPTLFGTGAELTPIAVLRGPEKKLGINTPIVAPARAVIDPHLSVGVKKFNRFFSMMDCYFHHYEITCSKTSAPEAIADAHDGIAICRDVLSTDLSAYDANTAIKSAKASILGGSSTIGGRVGAAHAISYGLSNSSPILPHSVAVTISMLGLPELYKNGGYDETMAFLENNQMSVPHAQHYGINDSHVEKMAKTALGMEKLWASHFGENQWQQIVTINFLTEIYNRIIKA